MLTASYINPLRQFGRAQFDLCLDDSVTGECVRRFQPTFDADVTPEAMANYASGLMARVEADLLAGTGE